MGQKQTNRDTETARACVRAILEAHLEQARERGDVVLPHVVDAALADVQSLTDADPQFRARLMREVVRPYLFTLAGTRVEAHLGPPARGRPETFERWLENTRAAARSPLAGGATEVALQDGPSR